MSAVQFSKEASVIQGWGPLSLVDFFQGVRWEKESSSGLKQAAKGGDWEGLKRELLPEVTGSLDELTGTLGFDEWSWGWSWSGEAFSPAMKGIVEQGRKIVEEGKGAKKAKKGGDWNSAVAKWLAEQNCSRCTPLECLVWLDLFPAVAAQLNGEVFCSLWKKLFIEGALVASEVMNATSKSLLRSEAFEEAWRFSLLFWSVQGGEKVQKQASAHLKRVLLEETDEVGTPHGAHITDLSMWLAPFVRAAREGQRAGVPVFDDEAAKRFRGVTHRALVLCSNEGDFLLSERKVSNPQALLQQLLKAGDESVAEVLLSAFPGLRGGAKSGRGARKPGALAAAVDEEQGFSPRSSFQSDEVRLACLRNYISKDEAKLAIAHPTERALIELHAGGTSFLKGEWKSSLLRGKKRVSVAQPWSNTCWNCDEDSEYFEMQVDLPGGGQIDRQILVPRKGHFAVFGEAVTKLSGGRVEHETRFPVAPGITVEEDPKTREIRLVGNGKTARFFALPMPQWRTESTAGSLSVEGNEIVLKWTAEGTGFYVPFVLDWDPLRTKSDAVWKKLTVTENLERVKPDAAAGYRLKVGAVHQLLIYRALVPSWEPRACLGFQTRYETAIGRFSSEGDLLPLMYVE